MSIDVNVQNDLVIVTESSEDITVNVSNAAGPAGVGVPTGGTTGQVLKKLTNTDYDTYWALDGGGVPYSGATGDVNLGEFQLIAGQVTLDTTPTGTAVVGTTRWNDTIGSSETTLKGGNVILKNGVDLVARVVNKVTPNATLTKANYQAVRISGAQGQRLAVALAQANNDTNSADTIGLVTETIATNQEGFIMTMGQLENINTTGSLQGETWVDGDVLYLSPTTAGAITKVKPTGAGHIVVIGYVEYAHAINGKIYVKVMNGWELDELHDVDIVTPANNEALIYESSTALWKNKTIATALGYTPISGSGVTGQVAYWNGTNSQTGSNNLFWDAANARLGIGTNAPAYRLHNVGTSAFDNGASGDALTILNNGYISMASTRFRGITSAFQFQDNAYNIRSQIAVTGGLTYFANGGGNVSIGSSTDGGQRLQVYGDAFIKGSGATSATSALVVQDSASTQLFNVRNDGIIFLKRWTGGFGTVIGGDATTGTLFEQTLGNAGSHTAIGFNCAFSNTSGTSNHLIIAGNFNPTSGTGVNTSVNIARTVNQTGGANGITRGLYINPTLTAAADWRSIEWSNNSGWGLYGAGTANNYLGGSLGIGQTSPARLLEVSTPAGGDVILARFRTGNSGSNAGIEFVNSTNINSQIVGLWNNGISFRYGTTEGMRLTGAGRLLLGTTTEGTFLLDVNGTARVSGAFSANTINNNYIGTNTIQTGGATNDFQIVGSARGSSTGASILLSGASITSTITFNTIFINATHSFQAIGTSNTYSGFRLSPTINQSSGANGITRGLYINPTLTAAADWRAIEVSDGVSVLAPSSTASATLRIPSGTAPTSPVNGDIWFDGTDLKMRIGGVTKTFTLV